MILIVVTIIIIIIIVDCRTFNRLAGAVGAKRTFSELSFICVFSVSIALLLGGILIKCLYPKEYNILFEARTFSELSSRWSPAGAAFFSPAYIYIYIYI